MNSEAEGGVCVCPLPGCRFCSPWQCPGVQAVPQELRGLCVLLVEGCMLDLHSFYTG